MVVTVGVCCMDVKLYSRPMGAILNRLRRYDDITIVPFGNRCIFDKPVELWPIVDFLICFYSAGFPLDKAQEYVRLRDPLCFNNVLTQHLLLDRTVVYKMLRANGIPVPRYRVLRRSPTGAPVVPASEDCVAVSPAFSPVPDLAPPAPPQPPTPPALHSSDSSSNSSSGPAPVVPLVPSSVPPDPPAASSAPGSPIKPSSSSSSSSTSSATATTTTTTATTGTGGIVDPITASQTQGKRLSGAGTQATDFARYKQMLLDLKNDDAADEAVMRGTGPGAVDPETVDAQRRAAYWGAGDPIAENEDSICVGGEKFRKPFVEKPVWAEDHNIYVYYPKSSGGGSKRLFRKVRDRSSKFVPGVSTVRRDGSYIYEEFVGTDGMDIKVYTVGPDYAHAEARKAPTVDGRVMRTEDGKEVRYHVILNQAEKEIARKITQIFGQNICGFDLLRTDTMSYVCDVNGFSFVKGSAKYYNDCAQIIYEMIQFHLHPVPMGVSRASRLVQDNDERLEAPQPADTRGRELRCLLAVIRHGDRTPKQKVKVKTAHPLILAFFAGRDPKKQVKFKSVKELQEFSAAINQIVAEMDSASSDSSNTENTSSGTAATKGNTQHHKALLEIKEALEETSHFSGINRKVQIKPLKWVFEDGDDTRERVAQALLIFKYGGQLTDFGFRQADWLGKTFRQTMYPADSRGGLSLHSSFAHDIKFYASDEGRVQMTAAMFAKAFLELDEEEIIPILYALVWNDDRAISWLDCSISSSSTFVNEKRRVAEVVNADVDFGARNRTLDPTLLFGGTTVEELRRIGAGTLGNPRHQLERVRASIVRLLAELEPRCHRASNPLQSQAQQQQAPEEDTLSRAEPPCTPDDLLLAGGVVVEGCDDATTEAAAAAAAAAAVAVAVPKQDSSEEGGGSGQRLSCSPRSASKAVVQYDSQVARAVSVWRKLLRVFYNTESGRYDVSKVPDILDCALYHMLHFRSMSPRFREVYEAVYPLAAWVVPHEYGISQGSKNAIAEAVVRPLVNKLLADLRQPREQRQLQTVSRFYFTSESHLNTLYNLLEYRLGRPIAGPRYEDYISHFVVKMYENTWIPVNDPRRFVVEVHHSPGANAANLPDPPGNMHTFVQPLRPYVTNMTLDDFIKALE